VYRGRLIFPFTLEIAQLDLAATQDAGFDPDFREAIITATDDRIGASTRTETLVKVTGSFHSPQGFSQLQQALTGNLQKVDVVVLLHFQELENLGLIEASTGSALIKVGDRLHAIYNYQTGALIQQIQNPPGAFITKASPIFGLEGDRNLLEVTFTSRDQGGSAGG